MFDRTVLTAPIKFWQVADAELFSASGPGHSIEVTPKGVRKTRKFKHVPMYLTKILQMCKGMQST